MHVYIYSVYFISKYFSEALQLAIIAYHLHLAWTYICTVFSSMIIENHKNYV